MRLYRVTFDSQPWHVEAGSMADAIRIWRDEVRRLWGEDYEESDEPEECALVGDGPVLREATGAAAGAAEGAAL